MKTHSLERKAAVIARMLPPHNLSINQIARQEGIPANTLYGWRSQAGVSGYSSDADSKPPQEWSREARFVALVETAPLSAHAVAEYCRRKGLSPEKIQQWKDELMQPIQREEKALIKNSKRKFNSFIAKLPARTRRWLKPPPCWCCKKTQGVVRRGKRGRITRTAGRLRLMMIQEAVNAGARQSEACHSVGVSERTLERWKQTSDDRRASTPRPVPKMNNRCWPSAMKCGSPACPRRKSFLCWRMRSAISPASRRSTGCCGVPAKRLTVAGRRRRKASHYRPGRRRPPTGCGHGISPG